VECVRELLRPHQHAVTGAQVYEFVLATQMVGCVDFEHCPEMLACPLDDLQIPAAQTELLHMVWAVSATTGSCSSVIVVTATLPAAALSL